MLKILGAKNTQKRLKDPGEVLVVELARGGTLLAESEGPVDLRPDAPVSFYAAAFYATVLYATVLYGNQH